MTMTAKTMSRTVRAVMATPPWSRRSWLELLGRGARNLVDGGDDHPGALHVGDPDGGAARDRRSVGRLGAPFLAVDAHQADVAARRDLADDDCGVPEQASRADAGV